MLRWFLAKAAGRDGLRVAARVCGPRPGGRGVLGESRLLGSKPCLMQIKRVTFARKQAVTDEDKR